MVQPVASTSCFSCTASYSPCKLIYDLVRRVATCVRSIFSAIVTFITSWCSWAEPVPLAAIAPVAAPAATLPAAHPLPVDQRAQGAPAAFDFLQARVQSFREALPSFNLRPMMEDSDRARVFLTRLMVWDLSKDTAAIPFPLPPFIAGAIDIGQLGNLRRTFNTLSGDDYSFVRYDFVTGVPPTSPTWSYSDGASAAAFMREADSLVDDFLDENELFAEIAESMRMAFLRTL
ncbi:MAG TPA: hypothetical protein VIJ46_04595 [Rhabdochlamydiaceae bacterium]